MVVLKRYEDETIAIQTAIDHLRVGDVDGEQKILIKLKLNAAIDIAEKITNRIIARGEAKFSITPRASLHELISATEIKEVAYISSSLEEKLMPSTCYRVLQTEFGMIIQFLSWPSDLTAENIVDKCWVLADVGFDKNTIPPGIVSAVLLMLGTLYDNESDELIGRSVNKLTMSAERLLARYRITP